MTNYTNSSESNIIYKYLPISNPILFNEKINKLSNTSGQQILNNIIINSYNHKNLDNTHFGSNRYFDPWIFHENKQEKNQIKSIVIEKNFFTEIFLKNKQTKFCKKSTKFEQPESVSLSVNNKNNFSLYERKAYSINQTTNKNLFFEETTKINNDSTEYYKRVNNFPEENMSNKSIKMNEIILSKIPSFFSESLKIRSNKINIDKIKKNSSISPKFLKNINSPYCKTEKLKEYFQINSGYF